MRVSSPHSSLLFSARRKKHPPKAETRGTASKSAANDKDSFTSQSSTHETSQPASPEVIESLDFNDPVVRTKFIMDFLPIGARKNKDLYILIYSMNAEAIADNKAQEKVYQKHFRRTLPRHTQVDLSNTEHREILAESFARKSYTAQEAFISDLKSMHHETRHDSRLTGYLQILDSQVRQAFKDATQALDKAANIAR